MCTWNSAPQTAVSAVQQRCGMCTFSSRFVLLCCLWLSSSFVWAETLVIKNLISVYDGDTIKVDLDFDGPAIFSRNISVRILGIDTPEIHGQCESEKVLAQQAKAWLQSMLNNAQRVELHNVARDKYFRVLADVVVDGKRVADQLIEKGLARAYDGGHKTPWCETKKTH